MTTDAWLFKKGLDMLVFSKEIKGKKKLTYIGLWLVFFRTIGPVGFLGLVFLLVFLLDISLIDYRSINF